MNRTDDRTAEIVARIFAEQRLKQAKAHIAALIEAGDGMRKALVGHTGSVCCTEATAAWSNAKAAAAQGEKA